MAEYDISKIESGEIGNTSDNSNGKKPNYGMAFLAGFGASVLVGIALAALGMWTESEYMWSIVIGVVLVSITIHQFVPKRSIGGAIIGAILTPATYLIYQVIMWNYGYSYSDNDNWFWFMLIGAVAVGAYMGYNNEDD